jgi:hypothetical protein
MFSANLMMKASKSKVNPLPSRAHGTLTVLTPQDSHRTRGVLSLAQSPCPKLSHDGNLEMNQLTTRQKSTF